MCQTYIRHLQTNYKFMENVTVVFDGGYLELSTKYTTHIRRNNGRVSKTIIPSSFSSITVKKNEFLLNPHKKQAFLLMLGDAISKSGINVKHANGDADIDIIARALNISKEHQTTVIGEDNDLLIIILHHFDSIIHKPVFLYSNISKTSYDIKQSKLLLGNKLSELALVLHALCGCDTKSKLHSMGAKTIL